MCALRDNGRNQQHDVNDHVNKREYTLYLTLSEAESLKQKPHRFFLESKLPEMEVQIQHEQQEVPMKNIHPSRIPIVSASAAVTPKLLALKITASALAMVSHCL